MKKIKVLITTSVFSLKNCGGSGVYVYELAKALSKNNVEVHIFCPGPITTKQILNKNFVIHWQKTINMPFTTIIQANKIIKTEQIDIHHSNGNAGYFLVDKIPTVTTVHHLPNAEIKYYNLLQNLLNYLDIFMSYKLMKYSKKIIAVSNSTYREIKDMYPSSSNNLVIIKEGVDTKLFNFKEKPNLKLINRKESKNIIFFPGGARGRRKGSEILFKSLSSLKNEFDFICVVSGKSRELGWSKKFNTLIKLNALEKNVLLIGEIDYQELPKFYSIADIVVYPSFFEGFGIPVLEALASKRPIIATKTGEINNIIKNNVNGLLINPGDQTELYNKLKKLLKDKKLRKKLANNGLNSVNILYDWNNIALEIKNIYQKFINLIL